MKIGIVGNGHVGKAMLNLFKDAIVYDKYLNIGNKQEINRCNVVFVCVPTPSKDDGSCDTSIVEEVLQWIKADVIILRSTVYVGFTDAMMKKHKKEIVFQPEYYGETVDHPFSDLSGRRWLSFGGTQKGIDIAIAAYQTIINADVRIFQTDAKTAEMAKYMENAFLATKVTFCNEMYDIANKLGVNYNHARELWIADPRVGASHTFVYKGNRGFGGNCLPKDIRSIIYQAENASADVTLLKCVVNKNIKLKGSKNGK